VILAGFPYLRATEDIRPTPRGDAYALQVGKSLCECRVDSPEMGPCLGGQACNIIFTGAQAGVLEIDPYRPVAAGGLAVGGSYRDAAAQTAKRIERLDPALDRIISTSEPIVNLATNLGGIANVEGPLWWKEGGYLLFRGTDLKRWKYAPGQAISVFKENSNAANGITRDLQGRLVACEAATRRVVREEHDGRRAAFKGRQKRGRSDGRACHLAVDRRRGCDVAACR
jgi:hypothetical protein